MKLNLEHLAGYLPYGLKGMLYPTNDIHDVTALFSDKFGLHEVQIDYGGVYALSRLKPIIRPLSDMTKEINYGLSSYIFIELFEVGDTDGFIYEFDSGNIKLLKQLASISKNNSVHDINYLPYPVVKMMLEYHFDIHGLIDQNLAIDINTL